MNNKFAKSDSIDFHNFRLCGLSFCFLISLWLPITSISAKPRIETTIIEANLYRILPSKGPFEYAQLFTVDENSIGAPALLINFKAKTGISLRLSKPIKLTGYTTKLSVQVEGFYCNERIWALFNDRLGKPYRLATTVAGLLQIGDLNTLNLDLRQKLRQRPIHASEESYIEFTGWFIEPDLNRLDVSSSCYLIMEAPVFDNRPYQELLPLIDAESKL